MALVVPPERPSYALTRFTHVLACRLRMSGQGSQARESGRETAMPSVNVKVTEPRTSQITTSESDSDKEET